MTTDCGVWCVAGGQQEEEEEGAGLLSAWDWSSEDLVVHVASGSWDGNSMGVYGAAVGLAMASYFTGRYHHHHHDTSSSSTSSSRSSRPYMAGTAPPQCLRASCVCWPA